MDNPTDDIENMRHPVPLTELPGSWRTFAIWAVAGVSAAILLSVLFKVLT